MIIPLAVVLLAIGTIALLIRRTDEPRPRRLARGSLYVFGLMAAILVVLTLVPVSGPAVLIVATVIIVSVVLVLLMVWVVAEVPGSPAERWAQAHGVEVTDTNREFVVRYVSEGHRLRLICGFGGAISLAALGRGLGIALPISGWVWLMGGYLGGVIWSEAWLTRLPEGTRREASLTPRRVGDYLVRRLRVAQVVVPLAAIAVGGVALAVSPHGPVDPVYPEFAATSLGTIQWMTAGIGIGAVALTVGVAWLQRHIVAKPQPSTDPSLIAADDAVRSSAVHLLSATAIGIVLVCIGSQIRMLDALGIAPASVGGMGSLGCWLAGLVAWRYYGHRAWVVHRSSSNRAGSRRLEGVTP